MFSKQPHVHGESELIGLDEAFRWTEDEVVTQRRRNRARRKRIGFSFISALALTFALLSAKAGIGLH